MYHALGKECIGVQFIGVKLMLIGIRVGAPSVNDVCVAVCVCGTD